MIRISQSLPMRHVFLNTAGAAADLHYLAPATLTSVLLGLAAAVVATILALPLAILAIRHNGPVVTALERSVYIGFAPGGTYDYYSRLFARFIGRFLKLESPVSRASIGCPAIIPEIRRAVVPLLPQSR